MLTIEVVSVYIEPSTCNCTSRVAIVRLLFVQGAITCSKAGSSEGGTDVASHSEREPELHNCFAGRYSYSLAASDSALHKK